MRAAAAAPVLLLTSYSFPLSLGSDITMRTGGVHTCISTLSLLFSLS